MDFFIVHRRLFFLNFTALAFFVALAYIVTAGAQPIFDIWVFNVKDVFSSAALFEIMSAFSTVFDPVFLLALSIVSFVVLLFFHQKRYAVLFLSSMVFGLSSTVFFKWFFAISRPESGITVAGNSFPSGHATGATIFFLTLLFLLDKKIGDKTLHFLVTLVALGIIAMTGASRLYLGVHWVSDVLAGFALGVFWVTLSFLLMKRAEYHRVIPVR